MNSGVDEAFYERADAVIGLANEQLAGLGPGKVSASTLYVAARFNAWVSAKGFPSGAQMRATIPQTVDCFVAQYRAMLEENRADYVANFERSMGGRIG